MRLHFLGGAQMVTGSCYLLETAGQKILIDCGLFQGSRELEEKNLAPFVFNPAAIDCAIATHSHLDHVGRLPQLVKDGFEGKIFATPPTVDFTSLVLADSLRVLKEKARKAHVMMVFGSHEVDHVVTHFTPVDYYQRQEIAKDVFLTFHDAGHILGSAIALIEAEGQKIVFSGDLGNPPAPLLRSPDYLTEADWVVVESTYGDRNHESPESAKGLIENAAEETAARRGVLLIPSFAMERTQQLLYHLNGLVENHRIPRVPIFIDSPLATSITEVYKRYPQYYNQEAVDEIKGGDDIFNFPGLQFTPTIKDSKRINEVPPPKIIIAGSGMSQGGRIVHHEARYLSDANNTLLMVSYQAEGTLGRWLADGAKKAEILDQEIKVRAKIEKISSYSSHADQSFLMGWLGNFKKAGYAEAIGSGLKKIFVTHGEVKPAATLAGLIRDELGIEAETPAMGEAVQLGEMD